MTRTDLRHHSFTVIHSVLFFRKQLPLLNLGTLSNKKNDIIWEFFPNLGPPPPFWEPLIQKNMKYAICNMKYEI